MKKIIFPLLVLLLSVALYAGQVLAEEDEDLGHGGDIVYTINQSVKWNNESKQHRP